MSVNISEALITHNDLQIFRAPALVTAAIQSSMLNPFAEKSLHTKSPRTIGIFPLDADVPSVDDKKEILTPFCSLARFQQESDFAKSDLK